MSDEQQTGEQMTGAADPAAQGAPESAPAERSESQMVPLDALQAERQARQGLQEELQMIKENLALMRQQNQAPKPQEDTVSDDEVMTYGDFKKALSKEKQQVDMTLAELRMTQKYNDYEEAITKYLPEVLKQRPELRQALQQTNDYELAYYLATNSESYKQAKQSKKTNADAERIVQNANKAGSLSSVGHTSPISEAKAWKQMSDKEFMEVANRNRGYF